jgi:outer membrane receptor for ferrienterochelin and colicins
LAARYLKENRWGGDLNWNNSYRGTDIIYGESIYTNRFEVIGIYQIPSSENIFFSYSYVFHDQDSRYGINSFIASEHVAFSQLRWEKKIKNHKLNSGLTFRYLNYQDNTSVYFSTLSADKYRLINYLPGIFIQDEFEYKNFFVFGGFRYDYNSYHGSIFTPRLGFKYQLTPFQILRFNFGRGFRVVNLFSEDHAALTGSREIEIRNSLNPEQSLNFILNYQNKIFSKRNFYLGIDASIFYNYFSNRIIGNYDIDPNKIIYDNLDGYSESNGLGLNLDLSFNFGLKFLAGISLMENYIIENNIRTIPILTEKISSNWSLGYSFKKIKLDLDYTANLYGPMRLPLAGDLDPRKPFSPWWSIHNIQVNYKGLKNTEIYVGVKNIFDWTPFKDNPFVISRAHDPFDRLVQYDNNGNVIPTVENPYALTFDAGYVYAPNIGLRIFLGFRYSF